MLLAQGLLSEAQHRLGGVDTDETPAGVLVGKRLHLQTATGSEDQHASISWHALTEENSGHSVKGVEAGHEATWPIGVFCHRLGVGEGVDEDLAAVAVAHLAVPRNQV